MSSPLSSRLGIDLIRSLIFSSISTNYAKIVNVPLMNAARIICFTNLTNSNLFVAITSGGQTPASDNTADQLIIPANGFKLIDIMANRSDLAPFFQQADVLLWARTATGSSNPTSGFIYAEVFFGD